MIAILLLVFEMKISRRTFAVTIDDNSIERMSTIYSLLIYLTCVNNPSESSRQTQSILNELNYIRLVR
jgi:hypothetical protein